MRSSKTGITNSHQFLPKRCRYGSLGRGMPSLVQGSLSHPLFFLQTPKDDLLGCLILTLSVLLLCRWTRSQTTYHWAKRSKLLLSRTRMGSLSRGFLCYKSLQEELPLSPLSFPEGEAQNKAEHLKGDLSLRLFYGAPDETLYMLRAACPYQRGSGSTCLHVIEIPSPKAPLCI